VLAQLGCSRLALHAGSVLLRLVDDFLLVTAIPSVARSFALAMLEGFESHNVAVNPDKTKLSFALQLAAASSCAGVGSGSAAKGAASGAGGGQGGVMPATVWRSGDGATFVKWCGLLLNTGTLELQGDYTRYCGEHIATSLTLPLRKHPGAQVRAGVGLDACTDVYTQCAACAQTHQACWRTLLPAYSSTRPGTNACLCCCHPFAACLPPGCASTCSPSSTLLASVLVFLCCF
jgi:hypothetical protein